MGSWRLDEWALYYVSVTADIKEGCLLVSSGLGARYPRGYPVAAITSVEQDPGEPFALVSARPSAQLDRSRYVLLVFSKDSKLPEPVMKTNEASEQEAQP